MWRIGTFPQNVALIRLTQKKRVQNDKILFWQLQDWIYIHAPQTHEDIYQPSLTFWWHICTALDAFQIENTFFFQNTF